MCVQSNWLRSLSRASSTASKEWFFSTVFSEGRFTNVLYPGWCGGKNWVFGVVLSRIFLVYITWMFKGVHLQFGELIPIWQMGHATDFLDVLMDLQRLNFSCALRIPQLAVVIMFTEDEGFPKCCTFINMMINVFSHALYILCIFNRPFILQYISHFWQNNIGYHKQSFCSSNVWYDSRFLYFYQFWAMNTLRFDDTTQNRRTMLVSNRPSY